MIEDRRQWDERVRDRAAVQKIAADLGLRGSGRHFFCPGCQPEGGKTPEMVIQSGGFECFRCGARGDVVGLVKLARSCDLDDAIAWLAAETAEGSPGGEKG
jgi:hypothetical protein